MKNHRSSRKQKILFTGIFTALLLAFILIIPNQIVKHSTKNKLYNSVIEIPHHQVGLLLGTSKYLSNGNINLYYQYRIEAAARLFHSAKIDFILISGDNSRKDYDEPSMMKQDLILKGIPENKIYLDYAGFRTLDSVVRCKTIFVQNKITIISQPFHNERAIYLAKHYGIDAVGYNAQDVTVYYGLKTKLRERLARVKMMIDLVIGKKPKYGGEQISIE